MKRSKESTSTKKQNGFEKKKENGKSNPKYVDLLEEDKAIAGQKFVCVSFVSPEKILKQKDVFFFEEFLKKWDYNSQFPNQCSWSKDSRKLSNGRGSRTSL